MVAGVTEAMDTVGLSDEERAARLKEEAAVRDFFKQFEEDQQFDKPIRQQIKKDRMYASGEAQAAAPVSTNMIGAAIDTQTSVLYARDPDVSVRPAPQVDAPPDPMTGTMMPSPERQRNEAMAKSLELVLSTLWKKGHLKARMRRVIRSILSASHGWLKVLPVSQVMPDPLAQNEYNTMQENLQSVAAQLAALQAGQTLDGATASIDDLEVQQQQLKTSLEALSTRLEVDTCYGFTFDVVKPENMQVGTDVELLEEYLDSDCITEIMYFPHDQLREKFPDLKAEDLQVAEKFYRKPPVNANKGEVSGDATGFWMPPFLNTDSSDEMYTTSNAQEGARPLAKVLERWSRKDNHVYTAICGVKVWARQPYQPSWASSRFYPYFYFSLNEVDGQRCPQSMTSRGAKLQDEYASVRSNQREVRRRSIPGTLADATLFADTELQKIQQGVIAEITPMRPTMPGADFTKAFVSKPVPNIDLRLYDTTSIQADFERTWGLSDTQQQSKSIETTATEEEIKAASANTRTGTWRDTIETVLSDMAQYSAEVALQKIPSHIAAKIAGPAVYWPAGMSLEDITSLVEVSISAGTTGKPRNMGDREAWGVIMPQIKEVIPIIAQLQANPQTAPVATALGELVKETMRRFGDESDLSRFLPSPPVVPLLPPPVAGPTGAMPSDQGMAPAADAAGLSPAPEPTPAVDPMQAGMEANGFFGPN